MQKKNGKAFIKTFIFVIIAVFSAAALTGCKAASNNPEVALAVVVGNHANAPDIPLNSQSIRDAIYNSCYTYGSVSFVIDDGDPQVYYQTNIPEPAVSGLTESKKESIANGYTEQLLQELSAAAPAVEEVDTLKAISLAAKALKGAPESADKTLVIMDSGLSTCGYIDFTKGMLDADPKTITAALADAKAIPDLAGTSVVWMFDGQTASPQTELSEKQKKQLQDIWETVLKQAGAKDVSFASDIATDVTDRGCPAVSVIDAGDRGIDVQASEAPADAPINTIVLDNTMVQFIGNKAEFADPDQAKSNISGYAQMLLEHPDNKVYLVGTTASGNREFCDKLSAERAAAVMNVLSDCGVPESQMTPMGLGYDDPWHIPDLDEKGNQIEEYAAQNRKVLIIDVSSDDARLISR